MTRREIQRAALAIAKMRTPKAVMQARAWQARRDVDFLSDWRWLSGQMDDPCDCTAFFGSVRKIGTHSPVWRPRTPCA